MLSDILCSHHGLATSAIQSASVAAACVTQLFNLSGILCTICFFLLLLFMSLLFFYVVTGVGYLVFSFCVCVSLVLFDACTPSG